MSQETSHEKDFITFHDGLSAWWEQGAQDHMALLGFRNRQLRCLGPTNRGVKYYEGKLVGDSPEICRGLDAYGFSHLKRCMDFNLALSSQYQVGDVRRMSMATPGDVMQMIKKCGPLEPTSEQIVTDILAFPDVLQIIIDANGCVVPDLALRSGRRYVHATRGGELKRKPRARQRKDTMVARVCHPDCVVARDYIRDDTTIVLMSKDDCGSEQEKSSDSNGEVSCSSNGISDDEVVQEYEIGAQLQNPHHLGCKVLSYNGRGLYDVEFDIDGDVRTIRQDDLRRRRGKTRKTTKPSFIYEVILPEDGDDDTSTTGRNVRRRAGSKGAP